MNKRLNFPLTPELAAVLAALREAGGWPLLAGGCVRDVLMGFIPKDTDIEVYRLPPDRLRKVLENFGQVFAVGQAFGVLKLRLADGVELDVSLPRRESKLPGGHPHRGFLVEPDPSMSPQEASARRDFTINAMLYDPASGELLDFYGGQADLDRRRLRHTSPAFAEDPLRVLRAMQFAARWNFWLDPATAELCRALRPEYAGLPHERVWGEWGKLLRLGRRPSAGLRTLEEAGWRELYPELAQLDQASWQHLGRMADLLAHSCDRDGLAPAERVVLLLAAIGSRLPGAAGTGETTSTSGPVYRFLLSIGCPQRYHHLVINLAGAVAAAGDEQVPANPAEVRRLALRLAPATIEQWQRVIEAELNARPSLPPYRAALKWLEMARGLGVADGPPRPLLWGRHLQEAGLQPGPRFGRLLSEAFEAQLEGEFNDLDGARRWLAGRTAGRIAG